MSIPQCNKVLMQVVNRLVDEAAKEHGLRTGWYEAVFAESHVLTKIRLRTIPFSDHVLWQPRTWSENGMVRSRICGKPCIDEGSACKAGSRRCTSRSWGVHRRNAEARAESERRTA